MGHKQKTSENNKKLQKTLLWFFVPFLIFVIPLGPLMEVLNRVPNIEIASMDLTVEKLTKTRLSAIWDLLIRIPKSLPDHDYICLQGDIETSILYKNITLVASSRQSYNNLQRDAPQQLRVSAAVSDEDIGGLIGKNMIKDIKEKNEVKFGSQIFLTDCRKESTGVMRFVCDETTLRFEPGSETKPTKFGNNPICTSFG